MADPKEDICKVSRFKIYYEVPKCLDKVKQKNRRFSDDISYRK